MSARRSCNSRMWCGFRSVRAFYAPTPRRWRRLRWCRRRLATGSDVSVNAAAPVVTDEADIIAVDAMNAGDLAETAVAGAEGFRDLAVIAVRRRAVGENAAGIVAGDPGTGAGEVGAERHGFGHRAGISRRGAKHRRTERNQELTNHRRASRAPSRPPSLVRRAAD